MEIIHADTRTWYDGPSTRAQEHSTVIAGDCNWDIYEKLEEGEETFMYMGYRLVLFSYWPNTLSKYPRTSLPA